MAKSTPIPLAMIGGGVGAFIGGIHRAACAIDGRFKLVAGAFSSSLEKSRRSAASFGLDEDRGYENITDLIAGEAGRTDGARAVAIVTPNYLHKDQVIAAAQAGMATFCEKPLTLTLDDARAIEAALQKSAQPFVLAHAYSGYPMVEQARELVASGRLGTVRRADVAYLQGWLAQPIERDGQKQAGWRTDPARSGGGASGDIATHAHHMLEHITGDTLTRVSARMASIVPGRAVDDDVSALGEMANGAKITLTASQIAVGRANGLTISVYGDKAGLEWHQEQPDVLWFRPDGEPEQRWIMGGGYLCEKATALSRTPAGHPTGFIEAFANLYCGFADLIEKGRSQYYCPGITEGVRGMAFLEAINTSSQAQGAYIEIKG